MKKILKNWNLKDFLYFMSMVIPVMIFCFTGPCLYAGFSVKKTIILSVIALVIAVSVGMIVEYWATKKINKE
jgi:MFS-type transporter involved in bile tolerance (Atg22 family)